MAVYTGGVAATADAEVVAPLPKQGTLEAQCSYCESSDSGKMACSPKTDKNYCSCLTTSESNVRVQFREAKKPDWESFKTFLNRKVKELQKKLKKKKKSKAAIKKAVNQLVKKLTAQHAKLLGLCLANANTIIGGGSSGTGLVQLAKKNGYTLSFGNLGKHSFAFDITDKGALSGAFYKDEPAPDPSVAERDLRVGLRLKDHGYAPNTPFVWTGSSIKKMCDNCTGLSIGSLNDTGKVALGTKNIGVAGSAKIGTIFNYNSGALSDIPNVQGNPVTASEINEQNAFVASMTNADGSTDGIVWINGAPTVLSREPILNLLNAKLKPLVEAGIKRRLRDGQDLNECGDAEIESTKVIGQPRRGNAPSIFATRITNNLYVMGHIIDAVITEWDYTGLCQSGTEYVGATSHTFVVSPTNQITVIPGTAVQGDPNSDIKLSAGADVNIFGHLVGIGSSDATVHGIQRLQLSLARGESMWTMASIGAGPMSVVAPVDINDTNTEVGLYSTDTSTKKFRAFAVLGGIFTDLTSFMDIKPDSGITLETATAVNNCGVIVGRSWNEKTQSNRLFILAKDGCPIPS
jgi:hypothetical protein